MTPEPATVAGVLVWLIRHPGDALIRRWNYKSALLSAALRSTLFLLTNLRAGLDAATAAMLTECAFRLCTAGFYGALTQAFRRAEPRWAATLAALVLLPAVAHTLELTIHSWRGTPELLVSMSASVAMTIVSTAFNLFAMRRGALIVGDSGRSMLDDVRTLPRLVVLFVATLVRGSARSCS